MKPTDLAACTATEIAKLVRTKKASPVEVLERLSARAGQLRHAVATSITRRRAPRLIFQFANSETLDRLL